MHRDMEPVYHPSKLKIGLELNVNSVELSAPSVVYLCQFGRSTITVGGAVYEPPIQVELIVPLNRTLHQLVSSGCCVRFEENSPQVIAASSIEPNL